MRNIAGRTALVTGAGSGIGLALARTLHGAGMHVLITDIDAASADAAAEEISDGTARVAARQLDVSDSHAFQAIVDWAWRDHGGIQVLCNNAGVDGYRGGAIWEAGDDDWRWTLGINLGGAVNGVRAALPRMLESGQPGHIVTTASAAAVIAASSLYSISKHAVLAFTETLAIELRTRGAVIGVTALLPDVVATPFFRQRRRFGESAEASRDLERGAATRVELDQRINREGIAAAVVAERTLRAILDDEMYALTDERSRARANARIDAILKGLP